MKTIIVYPMVLSPVTDGYGVSFPDFPGCISHGHTVEDAYTQAYAGLTFHIRGMKEDNEPLPKSTTYKDVEADPALGDIVMLIHVED